MTQKPQKLRKKDLPHQMFEKENFTGFPENFIELSTKVSE